jgi:oxygen-dependent protoporphyrinogen oxidase
VSNHVPALVIGAGLSGLACAHALRQAGVEAHVIEAAPVAGGVIRSERRDGYLLEFGPQSFNATAVVLNLCRELGIEDQLLRAPERAPRYVLVDGALREVPLTPPAFMKSSLVGLGTKARVLKDVLGHSAPPEGEESVAAFVRRKFSPELLEKLVGPFVSGIYAGDPEKLGLRSAFPQLYEAEKSTGSVVKGLMRGGKKDKAASEKPSLQTFRDGNRTLTDALAASLGPNIRCAVEARGVRILAGAGRGPAYEVTVGANGGEEIIAADRLILATPTQQVAALLRGVDGQFEGLLEKIEYVPMAVVSLGYPRSAVRHALEGFGFLVPRSSGLRILGTVWNSSLFPNRAPEGHVLVTSFVGGALDRQVSDMSEAQLADTVHRELAGLLGISQAPAFSNAEIWPQAIPQYNLGHAERIVRLAELQAKYPGLHLVGNYLHGPAWGACIEEALTVAGQAGIK